jgi:hypothetical protein
MDIAQSAFTCLKDKKNYNYENLWFKILGPFSKGGFAKYPESLIILIRGLIFTLVATIFKQFETKRQIEVDFIDVCNEIMLKKAFLGQKIQNVLPNHVLSGFMPIFKRAISTNKMQLFEYSLSMPDGINFYEARTICFEKDKILSIVRDISGCEKNEQQIKDREKKISLLMNSTAEGIFGNGEISIYPGRSENNIVITLSDNGLGIDKDCLLKPWEVSPQFSTPGTANEKGTGLVLALCKEFVEKHGGKIWVESEQERGSDFKFNIPSYQEY